MKTIKIIALTIAGCFSLPALSSVELTSDTNLEILVVNGKKAKVESSLLSSTQSITLPNGENQIAFRYTYSYRRGDKHERFDTPVIIAKFNAEDTKAVFEFPKFRSATEAEKNIDEINWELIDLNSSQTITKFEDTLVTQGLQLGRDFVRETQDYNLTDGPASIESMVNYSKMSLPNKDQISDMETVEDMLNFWYDKADPELKARFKVQINQ